MATMFMILANRTIFQVSNITLLSMTTNSALGQGSSLARSPLIWMLYPQLPALVGHIGPPGSKSGIHPTDVPQSGQRGGRASSRCTGSPCRPTASVIPRSRPSEELVKASPLSPHLFDIGPRLQHEGVEPSPGTGGGRGLRSKGWSDDPFHGQQGCPSLPSSAVLGEVSFADGVEGAPPNSQIGNHCSSVVPAMLSGLKMPSCAIIALNRAVWPAIQ